MNLDLLYELPRHPDSTIDFLTFRNAFRVLSNRIHDESIDFIFSVSPTFDSWAFYKPKFKRIEINVQNDEPIKYERLLFVVAHELRHGLHHKMRLFQNITYALEEGYCVDLEDIYYMELECDSWAHEYLRRNNINCKFPRYEMDFFKDIYKHIIKGSESV